MSDDAEISRRTLAKGAAWAGPVLAVAAAAPAFALSCPTCTVWLSTLVSTQVSSNVWTFKSANCLNVPFTITLNRPGTFSVTDNFGNTHNGNGSVSFGSPDPGYATYTAGTTLTYTATKALSGASALC